MNSDKIKGSMKDFKGKAKEEAGDVLDDKELEAEGVAEQGKGKAQKLKGEVEEKVE